MVNFGKEKFDEFEGSKSPGDGEVLKDTSAIWIPILQLKQSVIVRQRKDIW